MPLERRAEGPRSKARGATLIQPKRDPNPGPKGPRPVGRRDRGAGRGRSGGTAAGIDRRSPRPSEAKLSTESNARRSDGTSGGRREPAARKFPGFRINRRKQREVSRESIARFKKKVREIWRDGRGATSRQLRDEWRRYVIGWWGYYRLAEDRRRIFELEGWIRRHIRKCFWLRWHSVRGRCRALRRLGVPERMLRYVPTRRGAWFVARQRMMHTALSNRALLRYGFVMPSDLAAGR